MKREKKDLISVIIPVYNAENYLSFCIESIRNQSYRDLEIVLIDDGSTDCSKEICDKYAEKDNRLVVVHKENEGVSSARNIGLDICKGEYIAFVDADDYVHPTFIETLYNLAVQHDSDIVQCRSRFVRKYNEKLLNTKKNNCIDSIKISGNEAALRCVKRKDALYYCIACSKLFSKRVVSSLRFPNISNGEDVQFCYNAFFESSSVVICNEQLYFYFKHSGSATTGKDNLSINLLKVFDEYDVICEERFKEIDIRREYIKESYLSKMDFVIEDYWYAFCLNDKFRINELKRLLSFMNNEAKSRNYPLRFKAKLYFFSPGLFVLFRAVYKVVFFV